jgi:hypothetical protein
MGVRRTKEQKQQVQLKLAQQQYSYKSTGITSASKIPANARSQSLFAYDTRLIYRDLIKTILITCVILLGLVAIKFYLK